MYGSLIDFWSKLTVPDRFGRYIHPADLPFFDANRNSFHTGHPPGPYLGRIISAPVVILGLNGRYSASTADEFPDRASEERYLKRLHDPESADWSSVARYYDQESGIGSLIKGGKVALINGCAYRSASWSAEPDNRKLAELLPSTMAARHSLREATAANKKQDSRLTIAWRWGSWGLRTGEFASELFHYSTAPRSSKLPRPLLLLIQDFLADRRRSALP